MFAEHNNIEQDSLSHVTGSYGGTATTFVGSAALRIYSCLLSTLSLLQRRHTKYVPLDISYLNLAHIDFAV
jgi:hypothetical protein